MRRISTILLFAAIALTALTAVSFGDFMPSASRVVWSASGNVGAIVTDGLSIVVVRMDGTVVSTIKLDSPLYGLEMTSDGQTIAYATGASLSVSSTAGTGTVQLETKKCLGLHWSPDGTKLFYIAIAPAAQGPHGQLTAYIVGADGTGRQQVYATPY